MLRLYNIISSDQEKIVFETDQIDRSNVVAYVVYDTSTGISSFTIEDYPTWRAITSLNSSTGKYIFEINNNNLYPRTSKPIGNYLLLNPRLFNIMTLVEYDILQDVLIRFDLVRRRLPNPGVGIQSTDGIGENGVISFAGGYEKKMTIEEINRMIAGAVLEINATPPRTNFWPMFQDVEIDRSYNPYRASHGVPADMIELVKMGTLIRCLMAVGIMEVDIYFNTSDSGLQITWDRSDKIKGWRGELLNEYKELKTILKWNHACHSGVGIGSVPWASVGIWGTLMSNVTFGGQLALNSILGFTARGNVPI